MGIGRTLLKGSFIRTFNVFIQIIISFVMTPIIVHTLGDRMYGFWIFIATFMGYYGLLDLGLSSAVTRYISRAVGEDNKNEINKIINTSLAIFSIIGLFVIILSLFVILISSRFIANSSELDLFRKIIVLLSISLATGFPIRVFSGILDANLRYDLTCIAAICKLAVSNILIFILLKSGYDIFALAFASFAAGILEYFLIVIFAKKSYPQLKLSLSSFDYTMVKQLFSYSGKTFIAQIADLLRFRIDTLVIAAFLNVSLVTYYSIGARFVEYFGQIMISATGIMTPVFSKYDGQGDYESIRERFLEVTQITVILSIFIGSSVIFYSKWFIERWMGQGYENSYYVCVILCISATIALMQTPGIGLLYGISKHHYYAVANTCEGILNLILSLILVRYYGIYGVALGTTIEMLLFKLFIQPIFVCRAIELSAYEYYFKTIFVTCVKSLIPLSIYFVIVYNNVRSEYINIIMYALIQTVVFFLIAYKYILSSKNKQHIKQALHNNI